MVGIWLSVMALIVTISVMSGLLRETIGMIRGITPDLVLTPPGAESQAPPFAAVRQALCEVPGVASMAPRLIRPALLRVDGVDADMVMGESRFSEQNFVQVVGVDPALEPLLTHRAGAADAAERWPDDEQHPFQLRPERVPPALRNADLRVVLPGSRKFDFYRMRKGDRIALTTLPQKIDTDDRIHPLSQRFLVGGAINTGHPEQDFRSVYMHLLDAQEFAQAPGGYSEVGVKLAPAADPEAVKAEVKLRLAAADLPLHVETWRDKNAEFLGAVETERVMLTVLLFFFVAVACFNVFATVTVMVTDKIRDIGVLSAMGATRRGVLELFVIGGLVSSLLSSSLGCLSGVLVAKYINQLDDVIFRLTGLQIFPGEMYAFSEIPVSIHQGFVMLVFVVTLLTAFVCALIPALRAARLDPVEALRTE